MLRPCATWTALALGAGIAFAPACVNPKDDYDQFASRTASQRATAGETEAGIVDATPPDAGFMGTYFMSCVSQVLQDNPQQAVNFAANVGYTPAAGGASPKLTFSDAALNTHAMSISDIVEPFPPMPRTVDVAADGTATIDFGPTTVPGSADPTGPDIVFSDSKLRFLVSADAEGGFHICATQVGDLMSPLAMSNLSASLNPCIFLPAAPLPTLPLPQSDYHCF